jgi:hypothetical protein
MALWSSPKDGDTMGYGGRPTGKLVIKLPNLTYITVGSLKRLMKNPQVNQWYAVPLYNGKLRRVGNVMGIFGVSMNHGQLPGFKIYKLFTKEEILNEVEVNETKDDYPLEIAPNGDYETLDKDISLQSLYAQIFHSIANYHRDDFDVYF